MPDHRRQAGTPSRRERAASPSRLQRAAHLRRTQTGPPDRRLPRRGVDGSRTPTPHPHAASDHLSEADRMSGGAPHELRCDHSQGWPEAPAAPGPVRGEGTLIVHRFQNGTESKEATYHTLMAQGDHVKKTLLL